jgi:hypothetical protein
MTIAKISAYLAIRHSTSHLSKLALNDYKLNLPKNTAMQ